jgi:hypothetical protein
MKLVLRLWLNGCANKVFLHDCRSVYEGNLTHLKYRALLHLKASMQVQNQVIL